MGLLDLGVLLDFGVLLDLDPNTVKAGWLPLLLVAVIAVIVAVLYVSMRAQLRKIAVPTDGRFSPHANALVDERTLPKE